MLNTIGLVAGAISIFLGLAGSVLLIFLAQRWEMFLSEN